MPLDPNRWTLKTQEAFQAATDNARAHSQPEVTPEHLLAALLGQHEGVVLAVLQRWLGPPRRVIELPAKLIRRATTPRPEPDGATQA